MASAQSSLWFPLLGLGFAVTGIDKLFGMARYRRAYKRLGWTDRQMRAVGAAEVAGAALVACPSSRMVGGAVLALASLKVLASELEQRDESLAVPRLALLVAALTAFLPAGKRLTG